MPSVPRATRPAGSEFLFVIPGARLSDEACARQILSTLARRAYREPVSDADLQTLLTFYQSGKRDGGFESGIELALERVLASPKFLFRVERDPGGRGSRQKLSPQRLRTGLAPFVLPVEQHSRRSTAASGERRQAAAIRPYSTVKCAACWPIRKSEALVSNFAGQWLQLRNLRNVQPNSDLFPDFDDNLRQSFRRETELLFESVVQEDRSVLDLLTADYTFVNERLARHYGIPEHLRQPLPPRRDYRRCAARACWDKGAFSP